jgi:hypothetical protein
MFMVPASIFASWRALVYGWSTPPVYRIGRPGVDSE